MKGWAVFITVGIILGVLLACAMTSGYGNQQTQLNQVIAERDSAQSHAALAQTTLDAVDQELAGKDEQIRNANSERDQANESGDDNSKQISSLSTQVSDLNSHVYSLMQQVDTANQNFDNKNAEAAQLIEQNNALRTQLEQSQQDQAASAARIESLTAENQLFQDKNQTQAREIEELEASNVVSQPLIPVTAVEVGVGPSTSSDQELETLYSILIIFFSVWIMLGIGCAIFIVYFTNMEPT